MTESRFINQRKSLSKEKNRLEVQKSYADTNIETRLKGDKLLFTKSGNVYSDKMRTRSTVDEVILDYTVKVTVSAGNQIKDNRNRFASHTTTVDSFQESQRNTRTNNANSCYIQTKLLILAINSEVFDFKISNICKVEAFTSILTMVVGYYYFMHLCPFDTLSSIKQKLSRVSWIKKNLISKTI